MEHLDTFVKRLKESYNTVHSYFFKVDGRMKPEDFSRNSKLGFAETCLVILRGSKRSLQAAIYTFLKESKSEIESYTKQAFSDRRQHIKWEAFLTLFRNITDNFYVAPDIKPKTFRGMHVFAVDGTTYNLPNTPELSEKYGVQSSQGAPQTQAKGSCLYDVLNDLMVDVKMLPIRSSERDIAVEHVMHLCKIKPDNNLILLDRGYPSLKLMHLFESSGISYVMRCNKKEFFSELRDMTEEDKTFKLEKKMRNSKEIVNITMRAVKIILDNGVTETLITNITDSSFTSDDFKYLYHLRWGIEVKYDEIKNKLEIESFSGKTPLAVLQDFYATMFLSNLISYAERDCALELEQQNNSRERKYEYKINRTMAIASVKDSLIEIVMQKSSRKQKRMLEKLAKRLLDNIIPIRNNRTYPRIKKQSASRYPQNRKNI
jgi:hypothetical protein